MMHDEASNSYERGKQCLKKNLNCLRSDDVDVHTCWIPYALDTWDRIGSSILDDDAPLAQIQSHAFDLQVDAIKLTKMRNLKRQFDP